MALIPLTSGAYSAKDVIANAQRCVNLYPEINPKDASPPVPVTHYQRPGKTRLATLPAASVGRGSYRATNGDLFVVVGSVVYFVDENWQSFELGMIDMGTNPVSMADNGEFAGNDLVLVDGTAKGYVINMTTRAMTQIVDGTGLFVGADVVLYLQTFFLFNAPGTQDWYISEPDSVTFNALDTATKASYADNIMSIGLRQREPWLIGELTTEPWSLVGGIDFPFEAIPSTFVPYGTPAKYSIALIDVSLFWLAQNQAGRALVVKSSGYEAKRVSNHAIEKIIQDLDDVSDAIGDTYQIEGHTFYVLTFPTGNITLVYDLSTEQWHQLAWTDEDGELNRDRAAFYTHAYGVIVGLDWEDGRLYQIDPDVYTDDGDTVTYIRGWPHVINAMQRITHWSFVADIDCGTITDPAAETPILNLRYSDNRGHSFGDWIQTSLGALGEYETSPEFRNLGMARDRVYELMWSANMKTALNGAYVDLESADSGTPAGYKEDRVLREG